MSSTPTQDLSRLLPELMNLLHSVGPSQALNVWADNDLTMPQVIALHILDAAGPHSVTGLQGHLRLSASATSHMVDRLVAKGFVDRAEDPADRRQKVVRITEAGAELSRSLAAARADQLMAGLQHLPDDLVERLRAACAEAVTDLRRRGAPQCQGS